MKISGKTKRKYTGELIRFNKSLIFPLNKIKSVLPYNYTKIDIFDLFKELYPYEWNIIKQRYKQGKEKDDFLVKTGKKKRYFPIEPDEYLFKLQKVKHMILSGEKNLHKIDFNEEKRLSELKILQNKAKLRMSRFNEKINKNKEYIQELEPLYIDIFIQAYHKKGTTTEDKIEVFKELQKYECDKSINFFYKINDSERNNQIRRMAFNHLQSIGKYVKLRKNSKGNKKSYMIARTSFDMKPFDLVKKIEENTIQNKKSFDFFISHSSLDYKIVKSVINYLNKSKIHIYCDWFNDTDFLRRKDASEYTKVVLRKRIEQSSKVLFIRTLNTNDENNKYYSEWIEMEILYAKKINKKIECINLIDDDCEFKIYKYAKLIPELGVIV